MTVDELQDSIELFERAYNEDGSSLILLNSLESTICDVYNKIATCHRVIAEKRSEAKTLLGIFKRQHLLAEAQQAEQMLNEAITVQKELTLLRTKVALSYERGALK